ncbi:MAG TPA: hypothetical protein VLG47_01390 [Candidatus Saccharimonadales bacterium]|nr:hypothetical protein [Candidatus Saccharimonadales bacterium]
MINADTASPDSRHPSLPEGVKRSEQFRLAPVSQRREGEVTAGYIDAMSLMRRSQERGRHTLDQMGVQTFNTRPASVSVSSSEAPQEYAHIDPTAASQTANNLARPTDEVFDNIVSHNFTESPSPGPAQFIESNDGSAPDYRPQPVNQQSNVPRPPNNPTEYAAAQAALEAIHGPMQRPAVEQQPGVPLDQLEGAERDQFQKWDSEFVDSEGVNV